jgi:hypothetical protein
LQPNLLSLVVGPVENRGDELKHLEAFGIASRGVEEGDEDI